ncbi:hypothetical protein [Spiroplasma endosymbiont of Polydrusus pterygomalis]|uniref:hypothetical protein n=1 Tax=Spiroplasma endosymbiont of Polydrusus pterygomalis TaxID=3139327 RepID=UPI003CCAF63A
MTKKNLEKTINLEESTKNKLEYLTALAERTVGMSLESCPIKWSVINNCDCEGNIDKTVPKNKGPKI